MVLYSNIIHEKLFPELTLRQFEVMFAYVQGRNTSDIIRLSKCSRTTVERHLTEIRYKFNCEKSGDIRIVFNNRVSVFHIDILCGYDKKIELRG